MYKYIFFYVIKCKLGLNQLFLTKKTKYFLQKKTKKSLSYQHKVSEKIIDNYK
jgi:hypothetical protein